jgi:hypothetical protein
MGKMSRDKGARFEREAADLFSAHGWPDAHRLGEAQAGDKGTTKYADLGGTGFLWVECKRGEKEALAARAAELIATERPGYEAVLVSRRNHGPALATMCAKRLATLMARLRDLQALEARVRALWPGVYEALTHPTTAAVHPDHREPPRLNEMEVD